MKPKKLLQAVMVLPLLFAFSSVWAQSITINGLVQEEVSVKEGTIKIFLPEDIRPGDVISGTVYSQPNGENEKEKRKNLSQLVKYQLRIGEGVFPISGSPQHFSFKQPATGSNPLTITDRKSKQYADIPIRPSKAIPSNPIEPTPPTHALTGHPFQVSGAFDGELTNTSSTLDGQPLDILAESPRGSFSRMPNVPSGPHTLVIGENGKTTTGTISAVNMETSAGKLNLIKGEKTYIGVAVTGLQDLPDTATLSLINTSPGVVTLSPSNQIEMKLAPAEVSTGTVTKRFEVQSLKSGAFSVNVTLKLPEHIGTKPSADQGQTKKVTQPPPDKATPKTPDKHQADPKVAAEGRNPSHEPKAGDIGKAAPKPTDKAQGRPSDAAPRPPATPPIEPAAKRREAEQKCKCDSLILKVGIYKNGQLDEEQDLKTDKLTLASKKIELANGVEPDEEIEIRITDVRFVCSCNGEPCTPYPSKSTGGADTTKPSESKIDWGENDKDASNDNWNCVRGTRGDPNGSVGISFTGVLKFHRQGGSRSAPHQCFRLSTWCVRGGGCKTDLCSQRICLRFKWK